MKERILFVGIGACGSNIAKLFEDKGYLALYINTSNADLESIEGKHKYHIPAAYGCNKDRKKALNYAKDYYKTMCDVIDSKFPLQDLVYFVYGCGGGTGSGIGPVMLDILTRKNPNKHYSAVMVLPSVSESLKAIRNGLECYKQTTQIDNITGYVLDNNAHENKLLINNTFATLMNRIFNMTIPDPRGVVDEAELETLLKTPGNTAVEEIPYDAPNSSIFAKYEKGCLYIGCTSKNVLKEEIHVQKFGTPIDFFNGYNNEHNTVIVTGMSYPTATVDRLLTMVKSKNNDRTIHKKEIDFDIPEIEEEKADPKPKANNFEDLFSKYL